MRRIAIILIACLSLGTAVKADEGMFLVHLIGEKTYKDMVKRGLKLTKEQLYSMNKSSLKDAIVIFGGGCTGEIVSKEGLIFTNHHCGYSAIAERSTVEHDYLKNGFWAKSKGEELPCPGLSVQFLVGIEDVTDAVAAKTKDVNPKDLSTKLVGILTEMSTKDEKTGLETRVSSFFKGNQFLKFTYQRYNDVRLVGTPPESIGKFGGDTDNWEWPRHTGDFSIFRVYMGSDGKASDYKQDNIPYKPNHFLPVSIKGLNDGDYAMIYGYPGGTNRFETSYGIKLKVEVENPNLVKLRDERLKFMLAEMVKHDSIKLQLASTYAGVANYWKFFDGESKQLIKHNVMALKQKQEKEFETWAQGKNEYNNLFPDIKKTYDTWTPYAKGRVYLFEGIYGSPLMSIAASNLVKNFVSTSRSAASKPDDISKAARSLDKFHREYLKGWNIASDKNILTVVLRMFYNDIAASQKPTEFYSELQKTGDLGNDQTYKTYVESVFKNTMFLDSVKWNAFIAKPDTAVLFADPAYKTAIAFVNNYNNNILKQYNDYIASSFALNNKYQKGILEMKKGQTLYPDANFTMRVSYGNVKSYSPRDAVKYKEICTLKGVMEKYKPKDYEFDLPAKLIELIEKKDYGQYIDKKANDVVVCFITTNDITGGNSGSPVINANGELIGLAFDGNYEALSHKIAFDGELNRTICLDVRYLLFVVDKLGGAKNIIDELVLAK